MDEITDEFYKLKLTLSPVLAFLEDIRAVRKSRHISEESSIGLLGLLKLDIKEDVITTVTALQLEEAKRISDVEEILRDTQKEMRDKFYDFSQSATNLEMDLQNLGDLISRQGNYIELQNKNFDRIRGDVGEKASTKDILEIKKILKHYTPLSDFNLLSNQVTECAGKSTVESIKKDLLSLEKRVKVNVTSNELIEAISTSTNSIRKYLADNFVDLGSFDDEKKSSSKGFDRLDQEIKVLFQKNDQVNDLLRKKVKEILDTIKRKPWDPDIVYLQEQINECSTKSEFLQLKEYVDPKIESFRLTIAESLQKIYLFEKVLERYDEILLDKASKDDISIINSKLPNLTPLNSFKELNQNFSKQTELNFDKFKSISLKNEENQISIQNLIQKFEQFKKENLEVSALFNTLNTIHEKISEKADKSDIYLIYDVMGRKVDIDGMKEVDLLLKKQLQTTVVICHSLCRTMIKGGESPTVTRKQRFDLYRNLSNLIAWIDGEGIGEPRLVPSNKSPVNLKTEFDIEVYADLIGNSRLTRRTRRNIISTSPKNTTFSEFSMFPPLV
jgi:hypothetical protein